MISRTRFSRRWMIWLLPNPLPYPSPVSKLDRRRHAGRLRKRDNLLRGDGGGGGVGRSQILRRRRNLFFYKSLNTLCCKAYLYHIEAVCTAISRLFLTFIVKLTKRFEPLSADTSFVYICAQGTTWATRSQAVSGARWPWSTTCSATRWPTWPAAPATPSTWWRTTLLGAASPAPLSPRPHRAPFRGSPTPAPFSQVRRYSELLFLQ